MFSNTDENLGRSGVERRLEGDGLETHTVQVLDKPRQILALKVRNSISIFFPANEVAELLEKLWRSSVEVVELL